MTVTVNSFENPRLDRRIFCNRTLNLRSIRAIGYDMDYTLIHYDVEKWELRAYEYIKEGLLSIGWPVGGLQFEPYRVARGLIIDTERGNLLKANRFGFIKRAMHGTQWLEHDAQRDTYSRIIVDLSQKRWVFLNSLFSLSEGCMYAQLVDLLDQRKIPEVLGYSDLYDRVKGVLDAAHMEGRLKAEIIAKPENFVVLDPEIPLALLDQHFSGKRLMLITNSEWYYTSSLMAYAFDRYLPNGMTWRDLFDLVIVGARKPSFFTTQSPFFKIVTEDGLLQPNSGLLQSGTAYLGGSAVQLERHLGLSGDEILYVGDHMFGDVLVSKDVLRWRTALVLRELEEELHALEDFHSQEEQLSILMEEKEVLEAQLSGIRTLLLRSQKGYGPRGDESEAGMQRAADLLKLKLSTLDQTITPLAQASAGLNNPLWGLLMRAGNDKSHLAFQMERYADIYMSRVSNFMLATPFIYFRSARGSLPHDVNR